MFNLFKSKKNNHYAIQRSDSTGQSNLISALTKEIASIDQEIAQTYKDLLEVQVTRFRASFSKNANWLDKLQKQLYWSAIQNSSSFYKDELLSLHQRRRVVQRRLDKLNGTFWKKRLYSWLVLTFLFLIIILASWIILMGLIASLYLLPFLAVIFLLFSLFRK